MSQRVPSFSDASDVRVLTIEIPSVPGRIFRKTILTAGQHPSTKDLLTEQRVEEILKDAIYWLAGECKPVSP